MRNVQILSQNDTQLHTGFMGLQRTIGDLGQKCDQATATLTGVVNGNTRQFNDALTKIEILEGKNASLESEISALKAHLNTMGGVVAGLVDQTGFAGHRVQELSSQGGLVAGRLQGVEVGVGQAVDRLAHEQEGLRLKLRGLELAPRHEVAPQMPVTVNVRVDRGVEEVARGDGVPGLSAEALPKPKNEGTYTISLNPLPPGVPDIPAGALALSGASSRGASGAGGVSFISCCPRECGSWGIGPPAGFAGTGGGWQTG